MTIGERLSSVDRAWLLMDRPANPMTVMALLVLGQRLGRDRLVGLISERLLAFDRFRCVPVADPMGAVWRESPSFSVDDHVLAAALPAPGRQRELEGLAGELAGTPFPAGRPLWTFHLVEQYGAGSAIIVRIHHCYGDGIALLHVLLSLAGQPNPAPDAPALPLPEPMPALPAVPGSIVGLLEAGLHYALHPDQALAVGREALGIGAELTRLAVMPDDPQTRLKRPLSGGRRIAWTRALLVEEVRTIARVLGCTVNDVLVSTLAGALGRYLESQGDPVAGLTIRAAVPVNLRPLAVSGQSADAHALGNRFGLVFVELPIGMRHPLERLYAVRSRMLALKASVQAQATLGLLSLVGGLPAPVEDFALTIFSAKASLVASNLRGPSEPLLLAGNPIIEALFWVPQSGSIGTGVSMFSYCGRVQFGVTCDRALIAEPAQLVEELVAEFERLVYLALLGAGVLLD